MNKKIFLTSAVIMCMACPAIAEPFPGDGNMLENKTYDNAATYANTGIYEGDVTADAYYTLNPYSVSAGSYLTGIDNNNDATTSTCTAGNFCPGVASTTFDNNAFGDTGLRACPANYSGSATGATANTDCYRACANGDILHATAITGNVYYNGTDGDGVKECTPTSCDNGYHPKAASHMNNPNLNTLIGTSVFGDQAYRKYDGTFKEADSYYTHGAAAYGITSGSNKWGVYYMSNKGSVFGDSYCSTVSGIKGETLHTIEELGGDGTGKNCYCSLQGYIPKGGSVQSLQGEYWGLAEISSSVTSCRNGCPFKCANIMGSDYSTSTSFRTLMFNSVAPTTASCKANTINITWNDASAEDIAATGAATTVYEGDIKTPLKAVTKPGKTFVGWKFVKPAATPVEPEQGEGD